MHATAAVSPSAPSRTVGPNGDGPNEDGPHRDALDRDLWRIDARTEETLRTLGPALGPVLDRTIDAFYAFMAEQPDVAALLSDPDRKAAIHRAHRAQWDAFFAANFDAAYLERVRRLGQAHQKVGLAPKFYMAGYSMLLERMAAHVIRSHRFDRDRAAAEVGALIRAVLMEAEMALSVYHHAATSSDMSAEMEEFAEGFERELSEAVDLVRHNAASMEGAADEVLGAANRVATEGETVTDASQQTNMNARLIALAARGLSESFSEITAKVEHATESSRNAAGRSQEAQVSAQTLAAASERIGSVVTLIERIAKETRLLALNASIEAARAGNAGKGFAVVANEVKTLADQTNGATGDIRTQIEAMQASITRTVTAIEAVAGRVTAVTQDIASITESVGEQAIVTRDIADNADEMATSMQNVHESIERVAQAAERSTRKASELWENATGLVRQIFGIKRRVTASLRGTRFGNRRREDRVAVDVAARVEVDGLTFDSRLDNISMGGCQVREVQLASADGYAIRLDIDGLGRATGTIVATERDIAHVRFDPLPADFAARLGAALARWNAADRELVALAQETARIIGGLFDEAVDRGRIGIDALFSAEYTPIPGSDPPQVTASFTELCDQLLTDLQDRTKARHRRIAFCAAVDRNGYLPTHNSQYSEPQRPDDPDWNNAHCRNRRMFDDATGLAAARNRQPVLIQTYRRDMGGGLVVSMKDVAAPIYVKGKHWGAFRIGCEDRAQG